jgi:hypothetical protein
MKINLPKAFTIYGFVAISAAAFSVVTFFIGQIFSMVSSVSFFQSRIEQIAYSSRSLVGTLQVLSVGLFFILFADYFNQIVSFLRFMQKK